MIRLNEKAHIFILIGACAASVLLVVPVINSDIDNPNIIVYFSADAGYLMDLVWSYYSGQIRDSYQMSLDYGLEMLYLSDISRVVLSRFMTFTPGTFVLILRWLHLLGWVGALIAIWFLVGHHFGRGWQQTLAVLLLWTRPSFDYFTHSLKPDLLMLLFIIIGLNYALKIVEVPRWRYIIISVGCAAIGFLIKFAGIFLLPAIVAALYFSRSHQHACAGEGKDFPVIKNSWILPALFSVPLILSPFIGIYCYPRKATGMTYCQELGFWGSISKFKIIFLFWSVGLLFMLVSSALYILGKKKRPFMAKIIRKINAINSDILIVSSLFLFFVLIFGMKWIFMPGKALETYALNGMDFTGGQAMMNIKSGKELLAVFLKNFGRKLMSFNIAMLTLFGIYAVVEIFNRKNNVETGRLRYLKRMVLCVYLIPLFLSMLSIGRFTQHHMLCFFIAVCILAIQGLNLLVMIGPRTFYRTASLVLMSSLLFIDIGWNGVQTLRLRFYRFLEKEDVAFDIANYFKENIPADAAIISDHYVNVYVPAEYKNLRVFIGHAADRIEQLRRLVDRYNPDYIYYRGEHYDTGPFPSLADIFPDKRMELAAYFDSSKKRHQRSKTDKFFIYKVIK